jgi:hypothetical protein
LIIDTLFCQINNLHLFSFDDIDVRFVSHHILRARAVRSLLHFSRCCMWWIYNSKSSISILMGLIFLIPFVVYGFVNFRNVHLLLWLGNTWLRVIKRTSHWGLLLYKQSTFELGLCIRAVLPWSRKGILGS